MALLNKDTIKVIAEAHGDIGALSDSVASMLAQDVEYRLREILQEARKFMVHSKRTRLTTEDINAALKIRDFETLYGYSFKEPMPFIKASGLKEVFVTEEKEVDLQQLAFASLPPAPLDVAIQSHWLAIDGVQPDIPQNPSIREGDEQGTGTLLNSGPVSQVDLPKPENPTEPPKPAANVKHVLSRELQTYFNKITEAVSKSEANMAYFNAAMEALANDSGIHQLVPYFARYVSKEITQNLQNGSMLFALLQLVRSLLNNRHVHADLYLHQFIPAVLTCVVGKRLCAEKGDHWELRQSAAQLVASICLTFGKQYDDIPARVTKTLIECFLDPQRPMTAHFGSVRAIIALGPRACQVILVPHIKEYCRLLQPKLVNRNAEVKAEAHRVFDALKDAAGQFLKHAFENYENMTKLGLRAVPEVVEESKQVAPLKPEENDDAMDIDDDSIRHAGGKDKDSDDKERPTKRLKREKTAQTGLMRILALEELDRIGERYSEFKSIFGEDSLRPFIPGTAFALFTSNNA